MGRKPPSACYFGGYNEVHSTKVKLKAITEKSTSSFRRVSPIALVNLPLPPLM